MDLSWLPDNGGTGHMPESKEVIDFWTQVKEKTGFKTMVEIGFNAGHSSSILLTLFNDIKIKSYDIGQFDITHSNGKIVKDRFGDRHDLVIKDSTKLSVSDINDYDLIFIDGGHDYPIVSSDVKLFLKSNIKWCVLDDLSNKGVKQAYYEMLQDKTTLHLKQIYTAVLPYTKRGKMQPIEVPVFLLEK